MTGGGIGRELLVLDLLKSWVVVVAGLIIFVVQGFSLVTSHFLYYFL
jgi:hypothetical protein